MGGITSHMTISSFARSEKHPLPKQCPHHPVSISNALSKAASSSANHALGMGKTFHIPTSKWSSPTKENDLVLYHINGDSATLKALLGEADVKKLYGAKKKLSDLHISFRSQVYHASMRSKLLSKLEWKLCEVEISAEGHKHGGTGLVLDDKSCRMIGKKTSSPSPHHQPSPHVHSHQWWWPLSSPWSRSSSSRPSHKFS